MNLIDADEMIKRLEEWNTSDDTDKAFYNFTMRRIIEQPTVYDINKVVEQLEYIKMRHFLTMANTGDDNLDFAYEYVGNALDTAIEIVRGGTK